MTGIISGAHKLFSFLFALGANAAPVSTAYETGRQIRPVVESDARTFHVVDPCASRGLDSYYSGIVVIDACQISWRSQCGDLRFVVRSSWAVRPRWIDRLPNVKGTMTFIYRLVCMGW